MSAGRLAPTPSGDLHLGNITAFYAAWLSARSSGARLLLRMEDVDTGRARPEVEQRQRGCLRWLGLDWDEETTRQSERRYDEALAALSDHTYRCVCTRKLLRERPCPCDGAGHTEGAVRLRVDGEPMPVHDRRHGVQHLPADAHGHPTLVRRDGLVGYPLAVVVDDIRDGVTEVVRGDDLHSFTAAQQVLWLALGATPPTWLHTPLVLGPDQRKLSKSHGSLYIDALREAGWRASDVLALVGAWLGLSSADPATAVRAFEPRRIAPGRVIVHSDSAVAPDALVWEHAPLAERRT